MALSPEQLLQRVERHDSLEATMGVQGKVALVTGVTTGLGRAVAEVFAARGMRVVGTGRRVGLGEVLEKEIRGAGQEMTFLRADVRDVADCQRAVATTVETYGRIDLLVNNAGTEGDPAVVDTHTVTEQMYDLVVDTNLKGAFFCARFALEQMLTQGDGGHVLNIASVNAVHGPSRLAAYSASKAGLVQLTRTLADEYLMHGIRVNAIILGGVSAGETSQRTQQAFARYMLGPDAEAPLLPSPLDQSPEDVAKALVALCDDDAALITGAAIPIDRAVTSGFTTSLVAYMTTSGIWRIPGG